MDQIDPEWCEDDTCAEFNDDWRERDDYIPVEEKECDCSCIPKVPFCRGPMFNPPDGGALPDEMNMGRCWRKLKNNLTNHYQQNVFVFRAWFSKFWRQND